MSAAPRGPATTPAFAPSTLEAQRQLDVIALKALPALAAGLIAYLHTGGAGFAALIATSMLACMQLAERTSVPLALMASSRIALGVAAPVAGALIAAAIVAAVGEPSLLARLEAPVIGAWLVMALGAWVRTRFATDRHVRVAVVGSASFADDLADELEAAGIRSYEVVGWLGSGSGDLAAGRFPHLGELGEVRGQVIERRIELLVCARDESGQQEGGDRDPVTVITAACVDLPVRMIDASQLYEDLLGHVPLGTVDSAWFRYMMHPRFRPTSPVWKRCFDLAIAIPVAIIAAPLVAVAAIAIKLADGGPAFYRQRRVGERGIEFSIVKLRTMVRDAESAGPRWCERGDQRVTPLGRFLRRTHLDELPQLWNVARGEMTLVGPRPERPEIVVELERKFPHYARRHLVRPGITGWAQLRCGYAGSELGTAWKLCHDLFYVKHRSMLADLLILVETAVEATRDAHRALRAPRERFILGRATTESELRA